MQSVVFVLHPACYAFFVGTIIVNVFFSYNCFQIRVTFYFLHFTFSRTPRQLKRRIVISYYANALFCDFPTAVAVPYTSHLYCFCNGSPGPRYLHVSTYTHQYACTIFNCIIQYYYFIFPSVALKCIQQYVYYYMHVIEYDAENNNRRLPHALFIFLHIYVFI